MARKKSELSQRILEVAKEILEEQYPITKRRLHYLIVHSRIADVYSNTQEMYQKLCTLTTKACKDGELEYYYFDDPTRAIHHARGWSNIGESVKATTDYYHRNRWQDQYCRIECWVEKDGLISVLKPTTDEMQLTLRSMHGQSSSTAVFQTARTFSEYPEDMPIHIMLYGDFDPAGEAIQGSAVKRVKEILEKKFDTQRDITVHLLGFREEDFEVCDVDSIDTKLKPSDPMLLKWKQKYGEDARFAEVDALPRDILIGRLTDAAYELIDAKAWDASVEKEAEEKERTIEVLREAGLYQDNA